MCECTPGIKTPFCGKPGCEWPEQPLTEIREVFMRGGRYARCQFLTSWELDPPKYIVCHDVDRDHTFIATQAYGTWAQADVYLLADKLNRALGDTGEPE